MVLHIMDVLKTADSILSRIYRDYTKLLKYLAVGTVGSVADLLAFALIIRYTGLIYALALVISYCIGMVINYFLNRRFTFNNKYRKVHYQFASFALIAVMGLVIQELLMPGIIHFLFGGSNEYWLVIVTRVIAMVVAFACTYIANKKITFKVFQ
jgi:putative flippase GtrA